MQKPTVNRQTYSAPELATVLGISCTGAYNLMQAKGFPTLRIGGRILVPIAALDRWLEAQTETEVAN